MLARRGQSILEYTIIVGIVTVVLYYMGTGIKRGVQNMVKVTADQVGSQQNADQDFNDTQQGYMVGSNSITNGLNNKEVTEFGYIQTNGDPSYMMNEGINEATYTTTNTVTNSGFTPSG